MSTHFHCALNTSTIRGQKLTLLQQIDVAAAAGYDGIEPWIADIDRHVAEGGSLAEVRRRLDGHGLRLAGAIGFFEWIVDDQTAREAGFAEAERNMELVHQLGGTCLAAPPFGAVKTSGLCLDRAAERYAALCALGERTGVAPLLELWGMSQTLSRLEEATYVALAGGHPKAAMLLDVYHLYKGGTPAHCLRLLSGDAIGLFHVNDYPKIARETITDADRVYPGDGIAPLDEILRILAANGYVGMLSVELFNAEYWQQDATLVARTGLEKIKAAMARALG